MHFIINTAVGNHFCALFDADKNLVAQHSWEINRRDGAEVFDFLEREKIHEKKIRFIGGVTGPGGFTSLRVSSSILNALSFKYDLPIHQISAPEWIVNFVGHDRFVLNCFGETVWIHDSEAKNNLKRVNTTEAAEKFGDQAVFTHFLPASKKILFQKHSEVIETELRKNLLEQLIQADPKTYFKAFYNVSPVG
jgi:tRNA A37 threonylcarbamoyladenosine modification protein TsaB